MVIGGDHGAVPRQRWEEHSDSCRIVRDHATRLAGRGRGKLLGLALYEIPTLALKNTTQTWYPSASIGPVVGPCVGQRRATPVAASTALRVWLESVSSRKRGHCKRGSQLPKHIPSTDLRAAALELAVVREVPLEVVVGLSPPHM